MVGASSSSSSGSTITPLDLQANGVAHGSLVKLANGVSQGSAALNALISCQFFKTHNKNENLKDSVVSSMMLYNASEGRGFFIVKG